MPLMSLAAGIWTTLKASAPLRRVLGWVILLVAIFGSIILVGWSVRSCQYEKKRDAKSEAVTKLEVDAKEAVAVAEEKINQLPVYAEERQKAEAEAKEKVEKLAEAREKDSSEFSDDFDVVMKDFCELYEYKDSLCTDLKPAP